MSFLKEKAGMASAGPGASPGLGQIRMPALQGQMPQQPQGFTDPGTNNILQQIGQMQDPSFMQAPQKPGFDWAGLLGNTANAFAEAGGAEQGYDPNANNILAQLFGFR